MRHLLIQVLIRFVAILYASISPPPILGVIPDHPLPKSFPKDEGGFCGCLQDSESTCYVNRGQLFARFLCFDIIFGLKTA
ncbi:hypothetical protein NC653_024735 [Populus alba x Populus x berolinensis]|uniref:Uncharacterized protein n=1 Tax=Populus alba x Populus x berolinensis TaxID=444605 RepID=A0AAD6M9J1_9ROSI|nr:hypothetical protein NC653_024730 [Populus alba x Populus x berolinensis]KAJ6981430.1 hypothetical protein NC653_024735 [Populus alba x Populus x berolinensis]